MYPPGNGSRVLLLALTNGAAVADIGPAMAKTVKSKSTPKSALRSDGMSSQL
jgi:hypothetical protein